MDLAQENSIRISTEMLKIEEAVLGTEDKLRGTINKVLEPGKRWLYERGVSILSSSV